jgi:hypothetical protein
MSNRLSHSSISKWQQCPTSWKLHYVNRIRTTKSKAALLFGTALDKSISAILENVDGETGEKIFDQYWRFQYVNGNQEYIPTLSTLVYAKADFDEELVSEEGWSKIEVPKEEVLNLIQRRNTEGFDALSDDQKMTVNHAYWWSMYTKGHLMIKAFKKKVMPKIKKVHSTQEEISLENEEGDSVIGFIDLIADIEGYDQPVILDLKTSARNYDEETSVIYSPQLSLYTHAMSEKYNTRLAGYIVLNKAVIKNRTKICSVCNHDGSGSRAKTCDQESMQIVESKKGPTEKMVRCNGSWNETLDPDIYVQFLVEEIPLATENLVLDNIMDINASIKNGIYSKNLSGCLNSFGSPCDYINYCYRGDSTGLKEFEK